MITIRELVVQYAISCALGCSDCGESLDKPCLGCSHEHTPSYLTNDAIVSVVSSLLSHGLEQLTIGGADPLTRADKLIGLAKKMREVAPKVLLCIRTNGSMILDCPKLQEAWPNNAVLELLPVGESHRFQDRLLRSAV